MPSPKAMMRTYANKYGIDTSKAITNQQYVFLGNQLVRDYLNKKVPLKFLLCVNPKVAYRAYALEHGIDNSSATTFEDSEYLFLTIMDEYLKREITFDEFYGLITEWEVSVSQLPHSNNLYLNPEATTPTRSSDPNRIVPLDVLSDYLCEYSLGCDIEYHQPTMELIEQTNLTEEDYPHDWIMREALRYYKEYRWHLHQWRKDSHK